MAFLERSFFKTDPIKISKKFVIKKIETRILTRYRNNALISAYLMYDTIFKMFITRMIRYVTDSRVMTIFILALV